MCHLHFNPHTINNGSIAAKCSVVLRNKFVDYWSSLLHDQHSSAYNGKKDQNSFSNKLRTYRLIKKDYIIEDYLIHINNREERKMLAKCRCSNHSLLIETGRHCNIESGSYHFLAHGGGLVETGGIE